MNRLWRLASPGAMLALLIFVGSGGQLAFQLYFHFASATWQRVPATVEMIVEEPKNTSLVYRYSHEGKDYRGTRFEYLPSGSSNEKPEFLGYRAGDRLVILIDPEQPNRSVVKRSPLRLSQVLPPLLIMGVGAGILAYSWQKDKKDGL